MKTNTSTPPPAGSVSLFRMYHRDAEQLGLRFAHDEKTKNHLRHLEGIKWSATHSCYYLPDIPESIRRLINHCRGVVWVDLSLIRKSKPSTGRKTAADKKGAPSLRPLSQESEELVSRMNDKIKLKGYSRHTLKSYQSQLRQYLSNLPEDQDPMSMSKEDIEQYLLRRQEKNPTSESDVNMHINAIKFLYEQVLGRDRMLFYLPRPIKPLKLPKVLGEHELERIFRAVTNLKHKTILLTAFSCGLRVGEVIKLRIQDIDSERMQVFVERSKGKKDRYVTLSPVLLDVLRKYLKLYKPRPEFYLFEGQEKGKHYSSRSAQKIFNRAVKAAGIHKKVTFHVLRHSYATHLLEKGVDIKYIKELLGHFDIKTTERYLHVAREKLVHIQSPLDFLDKDI
jgi:integrase/recombinase XerD